MITLVQAQQSTNTKNANAIILEGSIHFVPPLAVTFLSVCMVSYAYDYISVHIFAPLDKTRLYKQHKPHEKLSHGILTSCIIFPYPRNKWENGSKKVSTASKSSRSKSKSHEVTYSQNAKNSVKKSSPCLLCGLAPFPTKAAKQPHQTGRSSLQSGQQKMSLTC